ncbi:DNA-processing protein DprA [Microbacterium resistens]|nr:DNA-processing protein DprA [Microbacterium resistens]
MTGHDRGVDPAAELMAIMDDPEIGRRLDEVRAAGSTDEARAGVVWSVIAEPGDGVSGALVAALGARGALEEVFDAAASSAGEKDSGRPARRALQEARRRWAPRLRREAVLAALAGASRVRASLLLPDDPDWPGRIADLGPHAPHALWVRGDPSALGELGVAVVGARASTAYGEHAAAEIVGPLAADGTSIVSGGAYGIDGVAHRVALGTDGRTLAILAGGVDRAYPSGHAGLLVRIAGSGAVVSEVPCGTAPTRWRFLARNRLIAAVAAATVVVEAGRRSGSLNTAGHAASLGRPLGAVPGPITSATSAGCHRLLREYAAQCVTTADEVRELLGAAPSAPPSIPAEDPDMIRIADALSTRHGRAVDELARAAGLSLERVTALLGILELDGAVVRTPGGWRRLPV